MPNSELSQDFKDLVTRLIRNIDKDEINGETIKDYERDELWQYLLQYMKNEGEADALGHYPIFETDLNADTLFQYISFTTDLDSDQGPPEVRGTYGFDNILNNLKQQIFNNGNLWDGRDNISGNYPWNESLTNALTYFIRYFDSDYIKDYESDNPVEYTYDDRVSNTHGSIPIKDSKLTGGFRITDVKNADAGNSFDKNIKPWVKPNYNIDAKTYDKVRGIDKIMQVLQSKKEMQFTHSQNKTDNETINKYIRLLMPKYLRRVEVEDLNRNFWVIGQTITAISAYLFDEDSPITKEFSKILNELVQLWENILYLWAALALISQKPYYTKVHTEVIYIPNDEYRDYHKFDNFDSSSNNILSLRDCWENRLQYLKASYPECHLCIVPVIRDGNYKHNYYNMEKYYGIVLYNRNTDATTYLRFKNPDNKTENAAADGLVLKLTNPSESEPSGPKDSFNELRKTIYAVSESEDKYKYTSPFSKVKFRSDFKSQRYYGLIRVIPQMMVRFDIDSNRIVIEDFSLQIYDAGKAAVKSLSNNNNTRIYFYSKIEGSTWDSHPGDESTDKTGKMDVDLKIPGENDEIAEAEDFNFETDDIKHGYYQGELISYYAYSKPDIENIKVEEEYFGTIGEPNTGADYTAVPSDEEVKSLLKNYISKGNTKINRIVLASFSSGQWFDEDTNSYRYTGSFFPGIMFYDPNEENEDKKYAYISLGFTYAIDENVAEYLYLRITGPDGTISYWWREDGNRPEGDGMYTTQHFTKIKGKYTEDGPQLTSLIIYQYDVNKIRKYNKNENLLPEKELMSSSPGCGVIHYTLDMKTSNMIPSNIYGRKEWY